MNDPIQLADAIKRNYALHFFGEYKPKFDTLLRRLQTEIDPQDEMLKMRGPFLQALSIPTWSTRSWEEFGVQVRGLFAPCGLHPAVVEGLSAAGIRRLQEFQERSISRIVQDLDTLVVAGTGRGKSESWLIPLFQYIVQAKLEGKKGTKALLIYPTKALAQDQFRRIIQYLTQINQRLPGRPITVGIYDGDTPYEGDRNLEPFLSKAFKFMDCPRKGTKRLCDDCINTTVQVETRNSKTRLTVAERECQEEIQLDFIYLTRESVLEAEVDILITNPDTINFQMININNPQTRKVFIEQPRFIVLDEVHIYSGLFGAFTAMLMRRLRQIRKELGVADPLRFIAASATVQNKEDIFRRLCDIDDSAAVIEENPGSFPTMPLGAIPPSLLSTVLDDDRLLKVWAGDEVDITYEQAIREMGLSRPGAALAVHPRINLGEQILEKLTREPEAGLVFLADIYRRMREESHTPPELLTWLQAEYSLSAEEARNLLANFTLLAGLAGILERRAHLFAWALDGYYGCAACGRVHASPVSRCECGNSFVSRLAFCTHCGEEVLEVWACSTCLHVYPMVASRDGESLFFDPPICHCDGSVHVTTRALIHPTRECRACGNQYNASQAITCPTCQAWTVQEGDRMVCTNPTCDWSGSLPDHACPSCDHEEANLKGFAGHRCESCGDLTPDGQCCGMATTPALHSPWICSDCGTSHTTPKPPSACACGGSRFHWAPLLDATRVVRGSDGDYMPGRAKGTASEVSYDTYKVMSDRGKLVSVTEAGRPLMPCQHPHTRWNKNRFNHMVRTPENILATSSQVLLRTLLQGNRKLEEKLMDAKMLTFSDSHRDMENVNRNFNEPERRHFLEALVFEVLKRNGRLTLTQLIEEATEALERYGAEIYGPQHASRIYNDLTVGKMGIGLRKRLVRESIASLVRPKDFRIPPTLVLDGIANLQVDSTVLSTLDATSRKALGRFWEEKQGRKAKSVYGDKKWSVAEVYALRALETRGLLKQEDERLYVATDVLQVWLVGPKQPGYWSPQSNGFHPAIDLQLGLRTDKGLVQYEVPLEQRRDPNSRYFSLAVYELTYSPPALLASRVYKGDTDKEERRETEHIFKAKPFLNHISSGPAMEVGIDIGNLNTLALYGTPPNINGYLQRIGRAGRRSKRSLVLTVSKSNPIDYYYFRWPEKLINSSAQPVPLTDENREVLKISLTWAVLDYIGCHYWVPWVTTEVTAGGETVKMIKIDGLHSPLHISPADEYQRLSRLLFTAVSRLDNGETLNALTHVLTADQVEIRQWLHALLGKILPPAEATTMIDEVVEQFAQNVYGFVKELFSELDDRMEELEDERSDLRRKLKTAGSAEERTQIELRRTQLQNELDQLEALREELKESKLLELQQLSRRKRYAYNLRSVSDFIEVRRRAPSGDEEDGAIKTEALPARDLAMALTEYHPAAMVMREERKHVVTHLFPDKIGTTRLHQQFGKVRVVCSNCGHLMDEGTTLCENCGSSEVRTAQLMVPGRAVITPANQKLHDSPAPGMPVFTAQMIYRTAEDTDTIGKTFALTKQQVGETPTSSPRRLVYLTSQGPIESDTPPIEPVNAVLAFANVELTTFVPGYSALFEDGRKEQVSLFYMCGEENCGGIIRTGDHSFCSHDPSHDTSRGRYLVLGRQFVTRAIRVEVSGDPAQGRRLAHSLAHGIRMALQQVAGVDLRSLGEIQDGNSYLVYEDVEGGYGITDLLLLKDDKGGMPNLNAALKLVHEHTDGVCKCDDGCPYCLYQYGCCHRNRPGTMTRRGLHQLLDGIVK